MLLILCFYSTSPLFLRFYVVAPPPSTCFYQVQRLTENPAPLRLSTPPLSLVETPCSCLFRKESPDIFFAGNQPQFATSMLEGADGHKVRRFRMYFDEPTMKQHTEQCGAETS